MSLKDLQAHLVKIIPGLSERGGISKDAILLMMVPPKASGSRAYRYKRLIDARVPGKKNNIGRRV